MMTRRRWFPDLVLLLTAAIWGFAFIAQRSGMDAMRPFTFNATRFLVGGMTLWLVSRTFPHQLTAPQDPTGTSRKALWLGGILTGLVLFGGASLQQVGLVETDAGKAGFITGMYVVLVPILGLVIGKRTSLFNWIGAVLAAVGLYLLMVTSGLSIARSDLLVLIGALVWAVHVHLVGHFSPRIGAIRLAVTQFLICGVLSLGVALAFEQPSWSQLLAGIWPLLYASFISVAIAYTLQVVAQQWADPAHAAIILSLEGAFAALGGWLILGEDLGLRGLLGAGIMLAGMLVSQVKQVKQVGWVEGR
jgi:drug/metabolite transporter (DMT)-like permease